MSGDLTEAIARLRKMERAYGSMAGSEFKLIAADIRTVLDAIEGGEWERRTPFAPEAPIERFCGPWRME